MTFSTLGYIYFTAYTAVYAISFTSEASQEAPAIHRPLSKVHHQPDSSS